MSPARQKPILVLSRRADRQWWRQVGPNGRGESKGVSRGRWRLWGLMGPKPRSGPLHMILAPHMAQGTPCENAKVSRVAPGGLADGWDTLCWGGGTGAAPLLLRAWRNEGGLPQPHGLNVVAKLGYLAIRLFSISSMFHLAQVSGSSAKTRGSKVSLGCTLSKLPNLRPGRAQTWSCLGSPPSRPPSDMVWAPALDHSGSSNPLRTCGGLVLLRTATGRSPFVVVGGNNIFPGDLLEPRPWQGLPSTLGPARSDRGCEEGRAFYPSEGRRRAGPGIPHPGPTGPPRGSRNKE